MAEPNQLLFFFSALGAFNGFLLALYVAFHAKKKIFANYFLALLLLVLSIRIIKSVFFYFNPQLSIDSQLITNLFEKEAPKVDMFTKDSPDELKPKIK